MLEGIIVKGIGGFYYVKTEEGIIESRAKGNFRENNITPLVGDRVKIRISKEDGSGYVEEILPRRSELVRPSVANVTQVLIVMSVNDPDINLWLLDKFIMLAESEGIEIVLVLNKIDLDRDKALSIKEVYENIGYRVILTSWTSGEGLDQLRDSLEGNMTVFAGPSGVGKSTLLNTLDPRIKFETGDISSKTKRGKHTTRHTELIDLDDTTYVLDSPGFSSLNLDFIEGEQDVQEYFREIKEAREKCKFISCIHINEPSCNVKDRVEASSIDRNRYANYISFVNEIKNRKRF